MAPTVNCSLLIGSTGNAKLHYFQLFKAIDILKEGPQYTGDRGVCVCVRAMLCWSSAFSFDLKISPSACKATSTQRATVCDNLPDVLDRQNHSNFKQKIPFTSLSQETD